MNTNDNTQPKAVINPWHSPRNGGSPTYELGDKKPVFTHRGVEVYCWHAGGFLHVLGGMAVTHREGVDKTGRAIDNLLDGKAHVTCCDRVADHLRAHGFTPTGYSDPDPSEAQL